MAANGIRPTHNLEPFMDQHARSLPECAKSSKSLRRIRFWDARPKNVS